MILIPKDVIENTADINHFPNIHWKSDIILRSLFGFNIFLNYIFEIKSIEQKFETLDEKSFQLKYIIGFSFLGFNNQLKFFVTVYYLSCIYSLMYLNDHKYLLVFSSIKRNQNETDLCYNLYLDNSVKFHEKIFLSYYIPRFFRIFVSFLILMNKILELSLLE